MKKEGIYDDMKIDLPLNGIELFWSDPRNPKSDYIKKRYLKKRKKYSQ